MKLESLNKGDKIDINFGGELRKAKVIENYPNKGKIYLRISIGLWGLMRVKVVKDYKDYNFELIRG